jgi:uncharacterized iron-regulated membrane protein
MYELAARGLAVHALASGGHGGRQIALLVLVLIIVALVAGWIVYAWRRRRRS